MKSVRRVFKKKLTPYNLRSRGPAPHVIRSSTPKVNSEVQVSLSDEENCTLLCELPYYNSSLSQASTHTTNPSESSKPVHRIQSGDQPRRSTAYFSPDQANITNRETIDISIASSHDSPILQPSLSKQQTPRGPQEASEGSSLEDFSPLNSRRFPTGSRSTLNVEHSSQEDIEPQRDLSAAQIAHSPADILGRVESRIHLENSKQNLKPNKKNTRFESGSSDDFEDTLSNYSREDDVKDIVINERNRIQSNMDAQHHMSPSAEEDILRDIQEQMTALQTQMWYQHAMQQQAVNALDQAPLPETISTRRPPPFHGYDSEDINRWLDKFENYLKLRRIDLATPTAQAELVMSLAGPAEDFYYSLPLEQKSTYAELRNLLRERFANDNQSWIIWQAVATRQQGSIESLDTYLTDLTNKFRRLNITDAEKMRYFVQGLRPEIRETVLLKQPKSFREAEEIARLTCAVKTTMNYPAVSVACQPLSRSTVLNETTVSNRELMSKIDDLSKKVEANKEPANSTHPDKNLLSKLDALVKSMSTNVAYLDNQPAVAALNDAFQGNTGNSSTMRNGREYRHLEEMIQKLAREMDARIRGLARRTNAPRVQQTRERTRDGRPTCFSCGQIGHFPSSCPERRNPSHRSQNQPQQRSQGPSYSGSPGYNQPRDNYRSFPSQNRRDQRLAVLDEGWYDEDFVAQFTQSPFEHASSETDLEQQQASEPQENVELRSNGTVVFSKQRPQNAMNLHKGSTLQQSLTSPSTYAAIRSQSLSAQSEVKQPPLPGIFCFSSGSANNQVPPDTISADQTPANVNTNSLLESILHAIQDLNSNQTQSPSLKDSPTQAITDDGKNSSDAFVNNSLASDQYSTDPEIIPDDTQPKPEETDLVCHSTPASNNSQTTELLTDPDTNTVVTNDAQVPRTAYLANSSPVPTQDSSAQDHQTEREAVHTSCLPTTSITHGELDITVNSPSLTMTQDEETTPLAPVSAQQSTLPQNTEQVKEFQPKPRDLTVTATVNGQDIKLLVDTGAGISVIDKTFLLELYANQIPALCTSSTTQVKTVSGQSLPIEGTLKVFLQIAGGTYPCDFHVVKNLSYEAVLGRDFLRAHGAVIDLKNGTLRLDNDPPDTSSEQTCAVRVWSTCVIPPQSESVIPAYLDANCSPGVVGLLEASPRLIERYQLQGAAALVTLSSDHTVPFRLINPTQKPVTLYRGATLGKFSRADENIQVYSLEEQPEKPDVQPPPAENVPVDLTDADLTEAQKAELQNLLNEYRDIFALKPNELGRTSLV
ncbi:hypothetical protein ACROYT_G033994 [Oculina patagonica]